MAAHEFPEAQPVAADGARFDALEYALHLRRHWLFIAVSCATAVALAIVVSLLLPKRYTATASILIEPPASTDTRTFTAISPVYLESLKTYESFATSASLFQRAAERFQLRKSEDGAIETIKSRVLKVTKPRDTKILQIAVTLTSPKQAQEMAQYLAEETVKLIGSVSRANSRDLIEDLERQAVSAQKRLDAVQLEQSKAAGAFPVAALRTELDSTIELRDRMKRQLFNTEATAATGSTSSRSRLEPLTRRVRELDDAVAAKGRALAEASTRMEKLEADRKTAQAVYDASIRRLQDVSSWVGSSGERLQVIDPGVTPERASEPRPVLYSVVAAAVALVAAVTYLSISYGMRR
jgi:uncharacterized protein involved in exopolysaccharide biosynthesis